MQIKQTVSNIITTNCIIDTAAKITQGKILCCYYDSKFRLLKAGHCFYKWNVQAIYFFTGWCTQVLEPCSFPLSFLCTAQDNQGIKTWLVLTSLGGWLWKWWTFWIQFCFTGYRFESLNACHLDLWVTGIYSFDRSLSLSRGCYKHCVVCVMYRVFWLLDEKIMFVSWSSVNG